MIGTMGRKPAKRKSGFGAALERARLARGLTQTEAAQLIEVTQRTWAAWELGRSPAPPIRKLLQLFIDGKI